MEGYEEDDEFACSDGDEDVSEAGEEQAKERRTIPKTIKHRKKGSVYLKQGLKSS
uniref:Uncharacterized protein n=2 Tax=Arion vulgaris TaxID=1028688 RepID=A0A0B7A9L8_9EUPU